MSKHTITLERGEAIDLLSALINYHAMMDAYYKEIEPLGTTIDQLNKNIMQQLIEGDIHLTDYELKKRTREMAETPSQMRLFDNG